MVQITVIPKEGTKRFGHPEFDMTFKNSGYEILISNLVLTWINPNFFHGMTREKNILEANVKDNNRLKVRFDSMILSFTELESSDFDTLIEQLVDISRCGKCGKTLWYVLHQLGRDTSNSCRGEDFCKG